MAAVGLQVLAVFLIGLWVGESAVAKPGILCPSYANVRCAAPPADLKTCEPKSPNCASNQRCCPNCWGSNSCYPPVVPKPGDCPPRNPLIMYKCATPIVNDCEDDSGCKGEQKCCQPACKKICSDPAKPVVKAGTCPKPNPADLAFTSCPNPAVDSCSGDAGCWGTNKCCLDICGAKSCIAPASRPGTCPAFKPPDACTDVIRENLCESDSNCKEGLKCCDRPCNYKDCVAPAV